MTKTSIQRVSGNLCIELEDYRCWPTSDTVYKFGEQVNITIEDSIAFVKDNAGYLEKWNIEQIIKVLPKEETPIFIIPTKLTEWIERTGLYILLLVTTSIVGFDFGILLGYLLILANKV
jgi:hypothetical protein